MSLSDLYESLASKFFALLWIVQKNKELKWSKNMLPKKKKKKKSLPRFPKEKKQNKTIGSGGKKKKAAKKELKKTISKKQKKALHLHLRANFLKKTNKLNSFNWNW